MGPLIPYGIITQEWTVLIIFLIGMVFGMILEQAGFSSSRKLVGIFFGYDFVVLKVFFTAAITAIVGIIFLGYFGWLDTSVIFVHSNYLYSAIVGGVIMGIGFVLGGYCPGTSATALSIGKIDGLFFIIGLLGGVLIYGEFFDTFSQLFSGKYFDRELVYNSLGMSRGWFVFWLIFIALIAFSVGTHFENHAKVGLLPTNKRYNSYNLELFLVLVIAVIIIFIPEKRVNRFSEIPEEKLLNTLQDTKRFVSSDELAFKIMHDVPNIKMIDVRNKDAFDAFHFPGAINIPYSEIAEKQWEDILNQENTKNIFLSPGGIKAREAWLLRRRIGDKNNYVLEGGMNQFIKDIFFIEKPGSSIFKKEIKDQYRFRQKAAKYFKTGKANESVPVKTEANKMPAKKLEVEVAGGC